jgi:hypothetical protein
MWLILSQFAKPSAFSFLAPVVVALSVIGLSFGLASVKIWSIRTRSAALTMLAVMSYGLCGVFYFAPLDVLEVAREFAVFRSGLGWKDYTIPGTKLKLRVPNGATEEVTWLPALPLTAQRFEHRRKPVDRFIVATGALTEFRDWPEANEAWFEKLGTVLEIELNAKLIRVSTKVVLGYTCQDYILEYPNSNQREVIRAFRTTDTAVILSVEGPFLYVERPDVASFLQSLKPLK